MPLSSTPSSLNLQKVLTWLRDVFNRLAALWSTPRVGRVAICSPLVGVIAGLGAVGFLLSLQFMYSVVLGGLLHFQMPPTGEDAAPRDHIPGPWWLVVLVPAVGGLISGILVFTWAPEAEGHGTDAMIRAFHRGWGDDPDAGADHQGGRVDHHDRHRRLRGPGRTDRADRCGIRFVAGANTEAAAHDRRLLMLAGAGGRRRGDLSRTPRGRAFRRRSSLFVDGL